MKLIDYVKNSSIIVSLQLNPLQWNFIPKIHKETDPWDDNTYSLCFLFLGFFVFISDGDW
jgi:hypothetical protein